tara:strand:+ start:779 stop:1429 length:651 start_codon:yes stop_codon:yes gene_type:complete
MSYILKVKSKDHPFNNSRVQNPYWGDYSYIRIFIIKPKDITGWIVQVVKRETIVIDVNDKIYNTSEKIKKITNNTITNSNEEYLELFRVINGKIVDEEDIRILIDDEFSSAAIKPYIKYNNNMIVSPYKKDNTQGYTLMCSKAYLIESNSRIDNFINKTITTNIAAANGLRSTYDVFFYDILYQYKISNTCYCELKVSWNRKNGNNKLELLNEYIK